MLRAEMSSGFIHVPTLSPCFEDGLGFMPLDRRTDEPSSKGFLLPLTRISSARIRRHASIIDILDIKYFYVKIVF